MNEYQSVINSWTKNDVKHIKEKGEEISFYKQRKKVRRIYKRIERTQKRILGTR